MGTAIYCVLAYLLYALAASFLGAGQPYHSRLREFSATKRWTLPLLPSLLLGLLAATSWGYAAVQSCGAGAHGTDFLRTHVLDGVGLVALVSGAK